MTAAASLVDDTRPLVAHVIYRLAVGGLENGVVNLINHLPSCYRHLVVSLTDYTDFARRIEREDVEIIALHKRPGHDWRLYRDLYRLFRQRRPAIVHSRNLAALEAQVPARLAGVPVRIHGEHGRDMSDPHGTRRRYILQRRLLRPFVSHYIALSGELERYLREQTGVARGRISRILNGVDTQRFHPRRGGRSLLPEDYRDPTRVVFGTVGRMDPVKDQMTLVRAFARLQAETPTTRLVLAGDGECRPALEAEVQRLGLAKRIWFAGQRSDVPELLRELDVFVLPSLAEGISNTIMEAMASGLPVVATEVGGNPELVEADICGRLVRPDDPGAMAEAMRDYVADRQRIEAEGQAARKRAEAVFGLDGMVTAYDGVYRRLLEQTD